MTPRSPQLDFVAPDDQFRREVVYETMSAKDTLDCVRVYRAASSAEGIVGLEVVAKV
jgi:hypothetical protein